MVRLKAFDKYVDEDNVNYFNSNMVRLKETHNLNFTSVIRNFNSNMVRLKEEVQHHHLE